MIEFLQYYDCIVWKANEPRIDDKETAFNIIKCNGDWALLQFQFACAYAFLELLEQFDKIQLRVFQKRLCDHPLYDFWFAIKNPDKNPFLYDALTPRTVVVNAFQWAISKGQ